MAIDPKRTAVVLIEYQNDFTSGGGSARGRERRDGVDRDARQHACAGRGGARRRATIVHAPITFAPGYGELAEHPYGILKGVVGSTAFVKGDGAPRSSTRWRRRRATRGCGGQARARHVRHHQPRLHPARARITTIALGGFLTNCCVESTMRTGYEKGYEVITLADCVAATSPEEHDNAIRFDYPMFSEVMSSRDLTDQLSGAPAGRPPHRDVAEPASETVRGGCSSATSARGSRGSWSCWPRTACSSCHRNNRPRPTPTWATTARGATSPA